MKRFVFRPAAVLDLRGRQHEAAQAQLAQAQQERDRASAAVAAAEAHVARAQGELHDELTRGGTVDVFARHRTWIEQLAGGTDRCRAAFAEQQQQVERAAAYVRRTHRQLRVMERLRDRAWKTYQGESRRHDMNAMDHLAVTRYARRPAKEEVYDCD